jgi:hypothetical protein
MSTCRHVGKRMPDLASRPLARLPTEITRHLAACPACRRALAVTRVARGLVAVLAEAPEPPPEFVDRVLGALPVGRRPAPTDLWRPAWGLVPAFAALVAGLVLLYQPALDPDVPGLLSIEGLSTSEQLVLDAAVPQPDLVLAAVLERDTP